MAKTPIVVNKLILTYKNQDYPLLNIQGSDIINELQSAFETMWRNDSPAGGTQSSYYYSSENMPDKFARILQSADSGNFDLRPYLINMAVDEEMYLWREDVGRDIRLVIRKSSAPNWIKLYEYLYGTNYDLDGSATSGRYTFGLQYNDSGYTHLQAARWKFGFAMDTETGKYIYYIAQFGEYWYSRYQIYDSITGGGNTGTLSSVLAALLSGNVPVPPPTPGPDQPYGDDDYDEYVGGDGDHDDSSDQIDLPAIPIAAATRCGMCTAYVPTWGEIQTVADALLDPNIFQILASNVVKFSDVIIGLSIFPCIVPASTTGAVKANVLGMEIGTGVTAHIADDQFVTIDCGTLDIDEYWGNCLDYNPYTRISIFLPFCGMYELDVDEVMGKTIGVSYRIDIMSGACLATIKIDGSVFYQYSGQCSAQVPLSSVSFDQFLASMIELGVATATGVGAVGAAGGAVKEAETAFQAAGTSGSGGSALMEAREHLSSVKTQSANSIADATVGAVMGSKGFYQHAGAMSGSPGFLGVRTPYIIIKRPEQLVPSMYGKFNGFPCNTTAVLGDLVGFTVVDDIRLNIPEATVQEIIECEQLLKGGVVI